MIFWVLYVMIDFGQPRALYDFKTEERCEHMAALITANDNAIAWCEMEAIT